MLMKRPRKYLNVKFHNKCCYAVIDDPLKLKRKVQIEGLSSKSFLFGNSHQGQLAGFASFCIGNIVF